MKVLIIEYSKQSIPIANNIANTINGCVYIRKAPQSRKAYWEFLTSEAAEFKADYVIEVSAKSKHRYRYRNVHDIFRAHSTKGPFNPHN